MELEFKKVYFLGIGGIGMSALALYFLNKGVSVLGYDRVNTSLTQFLVDKGAEIHYEYDAAAISKDIDIVIYTPAVPIDSIEWTKIRELNLKYYKRAEILGLISSNYKCIAVAGTHGKTTISTIISFLLNETIGCNAFLGGISNNYEGNYIYNSNSNLLVVEADEYDRSFLYLHPDYTVLTSMDPDHLDIYGTKDNMYSSFMEFISQTNIEEGLLVVKNGLKLQPFVANHDFFSKLANMPDKLLYYGISGEKGANAVNIRVENQGYSFDYSVDGKILIEDLEMGYSGLHNVENAVAAISIALALGVNKDDIKLTLRRFKGVKRRFDIHIKTDTFCYIDDYAHHPTEIYNCLNSVKELFPDKEISVIFQPHLYSRTKDFAQDFGRALSLADRVILLDIYPARELPMEGISSKSIGKHITTNLLYMTKENVLTYVKENIKEGVLLSMGAGDIDTLVEPLKNSFKFVD